MSAPLMMWADLQKRMRCHAEHLNRIFIPKVHSRCQYAAIGLGYRQSRLLNYGFATDDIAHPHRRQPAQFVHAGRRQHRCVTQIRVDGEAHKNRCGMPAAGHDATQLCGNRVSFVNVKDLWVVTLCEPDDLALRDRVTTKGDSLPDEEVLKVPHMSPLHSVGSITARAIRNGTIVSR